MSSPVDPQSSRITPAAAQLSAFTLVLRVSSVVLVALAVGTTVPLLIAGDGVHRLGFAYIAARWSNPYWQVWDLLLVWLALLHGGTGLWRVASATSPPRQLWWRAGVVTLIGVASALAAVTILTFDPTLSS